MSKEIIISVSGEQSRIAIVEDGELVELYVENPDNVRTIGDIHLARVKRILPGIKAAFVDVGQKQDAFLHFSDLSDNVPALVELAEGKVRERSSEELGRAPTGDSRDLELESPEEQLAERRRRDLKRTPKPSRGGRKAAADAPAEAASEDAAEKPARQRGRRRGSGASTPSTSGDGLPVAPAILPPDSPGAVEPDQAPAAPAEDTEASVGGDQEERQRPRRRRGRRRRKSAEQETSTADAVTDQATAAATEEKPADKADRQRGRRRKTAEAQASTDEPAAEAAEATEEQASEKGQGRSRGRRSRGRQDAPEQDAPQPAASEEAQPQETKPARSRGGRGGRKKAEDGPAEQEAPAASGEAKAAERPRTSRGRSGSPKSDDSGAGSDVAESKDRPAPAASGDSSSGTPRLARQSRFVIDLTAKSGSARREEEEEEEEKASGSRRGRRGGRGGSRRRSSRDTADTTASEKSESKGGNGSSKDDDDDNRGNGRQRDNGPRPETHLKQDQRILVKIIKEPISAKGSRVSTDISLAGRFLVLIPAADYVAVSKKIESSKERRRLRALARSLLPEGFGLIVRTVAAERDAKALDLDLQLLLKKWYAVEEQLRAKPKPPLQLYEDVNMVSSIIRDLFTEDYDRIVVDDPTVYRNIKTYVQAVAPQMVDVVQLHQKKEPVFRTYNIERDVRAAFESRVSLPGGGYLFIEHTEAMHVVDVNSGRAGRGMSQEENALKVNVEAAREIAKQLRLRDLGGIICVDFIDMRSDSYRRKVYDELKRAFRRDRAVTKLLPMSDFGVVEITRQRLRPSITTTLDVDDVGAEEGDETEVQIEQKVRPTSTPAPTRSAAEIVAHLQEWLKTYRSEVQDRHRKRPILIRVHPFLAAYLQKGIPSTLTRWRLRTMLKLRLDIEESVDPLTFSVRDEKSGKNLTRKYDPERRRQEQPAE